MTQYSEDHNSESTSKIRLKLTSFIPKQISLWDFCEGAHEGKSKAKEFSKWFIWQNRENIGRLPQSAFWGWMISVILGGISEYKWSYEKVV